jgi:hypothetical protein
MDFDRQMPNAAEDISVANPAHASLRPCYVGSATVLEVLFDQLEYLLYHGQGTCPSDCSDCDRLEQVKGWLLLPFRRTVR